MITPDYARTMAAYNSWQNRSLYGAAATLSDEERRRDRGAFFQSIHGTLSHLMWGDAMWMSRFDGWEKPAGAHADREFLYGDFAAMRAAREGADARIAAWAQRLDQAALDGDLTWVSGMTGQSTTRRRALLVMHMFNHQTHHRGQAHAMLTAAGAKPEATDLPWAPDAR